MIDNIGLKAGLRAEQAETVSEDKTARVMGSGEAEVYATPAMIAFMEKVSQNCVKKYLPEGCGTVGVSISVKHVSATPVGMEVRAESELVETDGRRMVFEVKAFDCAGLIGEGRHERFIVDNKRFIEKANSKNNVTPDPNRSA